MLFLISQLGYLVIQKV